MKRIGFDLHGVVRLGLRPRGKINRRHTSRNLAKPLFDSLYNCARWLVDNSKDAEDLVQKTYFEALGNFASFRSGTNFGVWLFRILKNTFLSSCSTLERRMTDAMNSEEDGGELAVIWKLPKRF